MSQLITTAQLCEFLQVSVMTVFRYRQQGMPYIFLSRGAIRYHMPDVLKWFNTNVKEAQAQ